MTSKMLPFDVGIEQEFFLTTRKKLNVILNAKEEIKKLFGFSIDQNDGYKGIPLDNYCDLVTDGTAVEIRGFFPVNSVYHAENLIFEPKFTKALDKVEFLKGYYFLYDAYIQKGQMKTGGYFGSIFEFDHPNDVFSSQKLVRDAYTGKESYQEKKEDKKVTVRTAGLHVHFSLQTLYKDADAALFSEQNKHHIDNLIKLFDKIYKQYFHIQELMQKRIDNYQPFGLYRIKKPRDGTKSGLHTIEYRQPSSVQLYYSFGGFVLLCQHAAYNYLIDNGFINS